MGMLHPTRDLPRDKQSELKSQMYPATVVNNDDSSHPDGKKRQRCQIRSPLWHRKVEDKNLPYAMPMHGGVQNSGGGTGSVNVPPVGAKVMLVYHEEDPHMCYYTSSPTTDDVHKDNELLNEDYPNTTGHVDSYGNKVSVNRKTGTITDTAKSGATISRDGSGNISLYAPGNLTLGAKGNIAIAASGNIQSHAAGTHSIKGGSVKLNCSDSAITPTAVGQRQTPVLNKAAGQTSA